MSRSIIAGDKPGQCFLCHMMELQGAEYLDPEMWDEIHEKGAGKDIEEHHIFPGPLRKMSEHYGLKVHLCAWHHRNGPNSAHQSDETARMLKQIAQREYESRYGHASFMQEFGQNYLSEDEWKL